MFSRELFTTYITLFLFFQGSIVFAELPPEEMSIETMPTPGANWFISKTNNGGYIFDAVSGQMQGLLSLSRYTPAVTHLDSRKEFYAAESYIARGVHGERTDIVAIYDFENLSPVGEVIIPNHMARLAVRTHLALTNNGRHLAILNMNPNHSISIVDVADRIFVYEISTPGCAVTMPVGENDLLQVCGDGTLQLIQLDASGYETNRVRSEVFFDVIEDPIFDRVTRSRDGWFLITHAGNIFEVRTEGGEIIIEDGWGLHDETHWRPGARNEVIASHENLGLVYVIMHEGEVDTHHVNGNEIWVYDAGTKKRIHRLKLDSPAGSIMVTQEDEPKLIVAAEGVDVYNALTFTHERTIEAPDAQNFEDF